MPIRVDVTLEFDRLREARTMIDTLSATEFHHLAGVRGDHCVSIYLPTHRAGAETGQDPIRLRNLVSAASAELTVLGRHPAEVDRLLAEVNALQGESLFWAHLEEGLAILVCHEHTRIYRLADPVGELVVVADRFHLRPLLASVASSRTYLLLALSENRVRLLRGDRHRMDEERLGSIPASLADALPFDDREPQLHSHSAGRVGVGRVTATMHGQGGHKDAHGADLDRFLKVIDARIAHEMTDRSTPLVLAGVEAIVARFRHLTTYPEIVEGFVSGNPDRLTAGELHDAAWPLARAAFAADRDRAMATVTNRSAPVVDDLVETLVAADAGRVQTLFVAAGVQQWGSYDPRAQRAEAHLERQPADHDLLDIAAVETFGHGGMVFVGDPGDIPGEGPIAAVLRF